MGKRTHPKPTVRDDWKMPAPPAPGLRPYARLVSKWDGWELYWATPEQADQGDYWSPEDRKDEWKTWIPWPFGDDDCANAEDLEALGFEGID